MYGKYVKYAVKTEYFAKIFILSNQRYTNRSFPLVERLKQVNFTG